MSPGLIFGVAAGFGITAIPRGAVSSARDGDFSLQEYGESPPPGKALHRAAEKRVPRAEAELIFLSSCLTL